MKEVKEKLNDTRSKFMVRDDGCCVLGPERERLFLDFTSNPTCKEFSRHRKVLDVFAYLFIMGSSHSLESILHF